MWTLLLLVLANLAEPPPGLRIPPQPLRRLLPVGTPSVGTHVWFQNLPTFQPWPLVCTTLHMTETEHRDPSWQCCHLWGRSGVPKHSVKPVGQQHGCPVVPVKHQSVPRQLHTCLCPLHQDTWPLQCREGGIDSQAVPGLAPWTTLCGLRTMVTRCQSHVRRRDGVKPSPNHILLSLPPPSRGTSLLWGPACSAAISVLTAFPLPGRPQAS